jgi:hypothetical protein
MPNAAYLMPYTESGMTNAAYDMRNRWYHIQDIGQAGGRAAVEGRAGGRRQGIRAGRQAAAYGVGQAGRPSRAGDWLRASGGPHIAPSGRAGGRPSRAGHQGGPSGGRLGPLGRRAGRWQGESSRASGGPHIAPSGGRFHKRKNRANGGPVYRLLGSRV